MYSCKQAILSRSRVAVVTHPAGGVRKDSATVELGHVRFDRSARHANYTLCLRALTSVLGPSDGSQVRRGSLVTEAVVGVKGSPHQPEDVCALTKRTKENGSLHVYCMHSTRQESAKNVTCAVANGHARALENTHPGLSTIPGSLQGVWTVSIHSGGLALSLSNTAYMVPSYILLSGCRQTSFTSAASR
eukprot:94186-Pyramimonas_sp.AAC.1